VLADQLLTGLDQPHMKSTSSEGNKILRKLLRKLKKGRLVAGLM
jgi:hypothetical protein